MPPLDETGLCPAQIKAIRKLEISFAANKARALGKKYLQPDGSTSERGTPV